MSESKKKDIDPALLVDQKVVGVFSTVKTDKVGTGVTKRTSTSKTYWYAKENENGEIAIQALNHSFMPFGPKTPMPKGEFLEKYDPEPEFYVKQVYPKMREMERTVERAEEHRAKGAMYSAEFEYQNALSVDEENVRANFGLGLTYLSRGEADKADDMFKRLVKLDAAFEREHKHLFNEFGINLRKTGMHGQAVDYYERALEITENDENLHYNTARAYYEKGEIQPCAKHLKACLELNPEHEQAREFLGFLKKRGLLKKPAGNGGKENGAAAETKEA